MFIGFSFSLILVATSNWGRFTHSYLSVELEAPLGGQLLLLLFFYHVQRVNAF